MSVEVVKDQADLQQFDATKVEGLDPAFRYRWIRKDPTNILMRKAQGYEIVEAKNEKSILGEGTRVKVGEKQTTQIEWGDMLLARIPMEKYEERQARERARIVALTRGVTQRYKNAVAAATGQNDMSFEDHNPKSKLAESMTEERFVREMKQSPEEEREPF